MAKDFGMEFETVTGKWSHEGLIHLTGATSYKIVVHPDSSPLLVPQVGDLARHSSGHHYMIREDFSRGDRIDNRGAGQKRWHLPEI